MTQHEMRDLLRDALSYVPHTQHLDLDELIRVAHKEFKEFTATNLRLQDAYVKLRDEMRALRGGERWPTLAANIAEALDQLEAVWADAVASGQHVEGDWRELGAGGNDRHRFAHARAWERTGNVEDLLNEAGRALMTRQAMLEARKAPKMD